MVTQNDYIFKLNNNNEYDYNYLSYIEEKLSLSSLSEKEALYLLKWIVYRVQSFLLPKYPTLEYRCCDAAEYVSKLLNSLNIDHFNFSVSTIIHSVFNIHELTLAYIPINDKLEQYIIDPTFRQFLVSEKCSSKRMYRHVYHNDVYIEQKLPPYPGYYLNLTEQGKTFGTKLLNDGFFKLTEENMKIYGDAFVRFNCQFISEYCLGSGKDYIDDIKPNRLSTDISVNKDIYLTPIKLQKRMCNNGK